MALARIITRSQSYARELALDLLSRGYTVEIVSPDRIPDNFADLELRVDAGPGDQLIASVGAHDGSRSASLDFVHHLKAPMADFIRRPLDAGAEGVQAVNFNAEHSFGEMERLEQTPQLAPASVPLSTAKVARNRATEPNQNVPRSAPAERKEPPPQELIAGSVVASAGIVQPSAKPMLQTERQRLIHGMWAPAFTFAGIVLLALLLLMGIRQTNKGVFESGRVGRVAAASIAVNSASAGDSKGGNNQSQSTISTARVPSTVPPAVGGAPGTSSKHEGDYVARDTVIYLDKHAANGAVAKADPANHLGATGRVPNPPRDPAIAANSVTYLNTKPPAKTEKRDPAALPSSATK